jgi:hypothetical protein
MESIVVNDTMLLVLALYGIVVYEGRMESEEIVCSSVKDAEERMCRVGEFVVLITMKCALDAKVITLTNGRCLMTL